MGMGEVRGIITLLTFLSFLGVCWWAYRSANRQRFERDALLPFAPFAAPSRLCTISVYHRCSANALAIFSPPVALGSPLCS